LNLTSIIAGARQLPFLFRKGTVHATKPSGDQLRDRFRYYANKIADGVGLPGTFGAGFLIVIVWAATGPIFHYSDTWQLVINTGTSVVTFLMVFLIQNTQNRDAAAMQLKLNELIRAISTARNTMLDLENCTEEELAAIREEFVNIRAKLANSKLTGAQK
jgi:low affinity Fe/Cu permease